MTDLLRRSVSTELDDLSQMIASVWRLAGIDVVFSGGYSGWNPHPDSPILPLTQEVYHELYNETPTVGAMHAGLTCGTISAMYPGRGAISVGPTLENVHSPTERMEIASVSKRYVFLLKTLSRVPQLCVASRRSNRNRC